MPSAYMRTRMTAKIMHCDLNFQQTFQHLKGVNAHTDTYMHWTCSKALQGNNRAHVCFCQLLSMMARHHSINVVKTAGLCSYQCMSLVEDYGPTEAWTSD